MCGRYAITLPPGGGARLFRLWRNPEFPAALQHRADPADSGRARPTRTARGAVRHFMLMRWGFLPGFVKDPKGFPLIINARAETLAEKASFRAALKRRRCLVIADGFYEWRKERAAGGGGAASGPISSAGVERRADGLCRPLRDLVRSERRRDRHRLHRHHGGQSAIGASCTTACRPSSSPRDFAAWLDVDGVETGQGARAPEARARGGARTRRDRPRASTGSPTTTTSVQTAGRGADPRRRRPDAVLILQAGGGAAHDGARPKTSARDSTRTSWPSETSRRAS